MFRTYINKHYITICNMQSSVTIEKKNKIKGNMLIMPIFFYIIVHNINI